MTKKHFGEGPDPVQAQIARMEAAVAAAHAAAVSDVGDRPATPAPDGWDDPHQNESWAHRVVREEAEKEARKRQRQAGRTSRQMSKAPGGTVRTNLSEVGDRSSGVLACPKCGGAQFRIKRRGLVKGAAWLAVPLTGAASLAALAAPKSRVQCVTCKTEYLRG